MPLSAEAIITAYLCLWLAVLGAVLGSFIDCAVSRWAAGEKMFTGRSRCLGCGHTLGALDLIPVVSFLLRRGRCRWCREKIPAECLIAELLGAAGFSFLALSKGAALAHDLSHGHPLSPGLGMWLIWWALLLAVFLADWAKQLIPDLLLLALAANRLLWFLLLGEEFYQVSLSVLKAAAVPAVLLAVVLLMEKLRGMEVMGGGDIKLLLALALYLSWAQLLLTLLCGCFMGIVYAAVSGKRRTAAIPFGPFLAAGALAVVSFGDPVLSWYFGLF